MITVGCNKLILYHIVIKNSRFLLRRFAVSLSQHFSLLLKVVLELVADSPARTVINSLSRWKMKQCALQITTTNITTTRQKLVTDIHVKRRIAVEDKQILCLVD